MSDKLNDDIVRNFIQTIQQVTTSIVVSWKTREYNCKQQGKMLLGIKNKRFRS